MLQKNIKKPRPPIGRPTRFKKKTAYNRAKEKAKAKEE